MTSKAIKPCGNCPTCCELGPGWSHLCPFREDPLLDRLYEEVFGDIVREVVRKIPMQVNGHDPGDEDPRAWEWEQ